MKIRNPEKRIEELNKEFHKITGLIFRNNTYNIKTFKKKDIKSKEKIMFTLNGQAFRLNKQREIIAIERFTRRRLIRELINLYKKLIDRVVKPHNNRFNN